MLKLTMSLSKACIRKNVKNSIDMEMTIIVFKTLILGVLASIMT